MPCGICDLKALKVNWMFKSCDVDLSYCPSNSLDNTLVWGGKKISAFHFSGLIPCGLRGKNIIGILYSLYCINEWDCHLIYFSCCCSNYFTPSLQLEHLPPTGAHLSHLSHSVPEQSSLTGWANSGTFIPIYPLLNHHTKSWLIFYDAFQ